MMCVWERGAHGRDRHAHGAPQRDGARAKLLCPIRRKPNVERDRARLGPQPTIRLAYLAEHDKARHEAVSDAEKPRVVLSTGAIPNLARVADAARPQSAVSTVESLIFGELRTLKM